MQTGYTYRRPTGPRSSRRLNAATWLVPDHPILGWPPDHFANITPTVVQRVGLIATTRSNGAHLYLTNAGQNSIIGLPLRASLFRNHHGCGENDATDCKTHPEHFFFFFFFFLFFCQCRQPLLSVASVLMPFRLLRALVYQRDFWLIVLFPPSAPRFSFPAETQGMQNLSFQGGSR